MQRQNGMAGVARPLQAPCPPAKHHLPCACLGRLRHGSGCGVAHRHRSSAPAASRALWARTDPLQDGEGGQPRKRARSKDTTALRRADRCTASPSARSKLAVVPDDPQAPQADHTKGWDEAPTDVVKTVRESASDTSGKRLCCSFCATSSSRSHRAFTRVAGTQERKYSKLFADPSRTGRIVHLGATIEK